MNDSSIGDVACRCALVAVVVLAGVLAGWSAISLTGGVVMGIALGAGVVVPVFRDEHSLCRRLFNRRRGTPSP